MSKRRKTPQAAAAEPSAIKEPATPAEGTAAVLADAVPVATPRNRPLVFRAGALVVGLLAGLLLVEFGLRVFGVRPERYQKPRWLAWDGTAYRDLGIWGNGLIRQSSRFRAQGVLMGEYVPGAKFKEVFDSNPRGYFDPDNGVPMEVNLLGLRGPLVTPEKPPGVFRILGLGDSFTFAVGVREPDTFLRRLESQLNIERPAGGDAPTFQVLNAGTQGYNIRDEVLYLEHRWLPLAPDLVLVSFYLNDAYADDAFRNMGEALGIYVKPQGVGRLSYVVDLVQHQWAVRRQRRDTEDYYLKSFFKEADKYVDDPAALSIDWKQSRDALARAVELGQQHGFRVALVIWPELYELEGNYPFVPIHKLVHETCGRLDIPTLDLLDTFRGHNSAALWVHPSDHHPNEEANRLAADAIARFLKEQHLLEKPSSGQ